jgi:hypothetical protein
MVTDADTHARPSLDAFAGTLQRAEIQDQPSSIPGREIVQVLTELPAGVESGWHTGGRRCRARAKSALRGVTCDYGSQRPAPAPSSHRRVLHLHSEHSTAAQVRATLRRSVKATA